MRAWSLPVVLSSVVLSGWLGGARAQDANTGTASGSALSSLEQAACTQNQQTVPGVIPQPNPECPGLVAGVTLGELYTDNLKLAGSGQPKETGWISVIQPFVKAAYSAPRFSGMLDYTLTGYVYAGHSNNNQLAQNLDAQGTVTVLPQHFYVDGTAIYGQQVLNNQLPAGSGTFFLDNNRANVGMGSISPYWVQDLGRVGTMLLRYTRGRVVYNQSGISGENRNLLSGIPDVTSDSVQFSLDSPRYDTWGWNLDYTQQRMQPDEGQSLQFARAQAGLSYQLNFDTRLLADVGKENRYLPDGSYKHLGAGFWDAGFQWANSRDSFKLLVGHRFYGRSAQLSWTHQAALLTTNVSYVEQPTDLNQQLLGQGTGQIVATPGNFFVPSLRERQIYLMKRASASATYQMPRGQLTLDLYDESRRYFALDNAREKVANAGLSWLFDLGPFTTFTPTVGWQRYLFMDGQTNYTRYFELVLVHQFNPYNFASLRFRNDSRDAYVVVPSANGYRVNVIYLQWTHLF
ncbi:MAG: TIGR03016 family PEP-CTERM system-associated outer membrane protein [Rhodanobacteraceae bacterium]|nr:MAG: TIGR03016 family PEP-CTERM system-associated outer membrane protein [Rhodanobacteraceae bacterium]